jgi:hypothetical protein
VALNNYLIIREMDEKTKLQVIEQLNEQIRVAKEALKELEKDNVPKDMLEYFKNGEKKEW